MPSKETSAPHAIAIVGAGFAGLTLANYLSDIQCIVFEAKDQPVPIVGTIRLPSVFRISQELGLLIPGLKRLYDISSQLVDRQAFLKALRAHATIEYGFTVERIKQDAQGRRWLMNSRGRRHGPFDAIIVANGLSFDAVSTQLILDCDAVVGDARWQYDMWFWDFGRTRVDRGGNIALEDARELAQAILSCIIQKQKTPNELHEGIPFKFRPKSDLRRWHASKCLFTAFVAVLIARLLSTLKKV